MIEVKLGAKAEPGITLRQSNDLVAVRTRSRRSVRGGAVPGPEAALLADATLVTSFPEAGVEVFRLPSDGREEVQQRKAALAAEPDVQFAGRVLVDDAGDPVLYTENMFVKFHDDVAADECQDALREAGVQVKDQPRYATNAYFVVMPEGSGRRVFETASTLLEDDRVEFCHPELIRQARSRAIAPEQWHLTPTSVNGIRVNAGVDAAGAHAITRGAGVVIAVIDDGVDVDHGEFAGAGKIVAPFDATLGSEDAHPKSASNNHGTACAGVACANGDRASGVAPDAALMPIRLVSGLGSRNEAEAFRWAADNGADIISCSWGPADGQWWNPSDPSHDVDVPLPAMTRLAIDYATEHGRQGRGCVICWAAGNGRESVDNDGYARYERVLAIAACNDRGVRSVYSDAGDAVFCSFPSGDTAWPAFNQPEPLTPGIWTTDRRGSAGYNPGRDSQGDTHGDFTNDFGGTSSACPGVAGIAALVIAANPELNWQEVRDVIRRSCVKIDVDGGDYDETGHSRVYGHGRPDAATAVMLARPARRDRLVTRREVDIPLPDLQAVELQIDIGVGGTAASLGVAIGIEHSYIGDLEITLTPPGSTGVDAVVLHNRSGGGRADINRVYSAVTTPQLGAFAGKPIAGTWTLRVEDHAMRDEGRILSFAIEADLAPVVDRAAVQRRKKRSVSKKKATKRRARQA